MDVFICFSYHSEFYILSPTIVDFYHHQLIYLRQRVEPLHPQQHDTIYLNPAVHRVFYTYWEALTADLSPNLRLLSILHILGGTNRRFEP
ncbi:hypothetical protein RRG08_013392 [Elysia crispata]|uniref:Uncharacterized protein n=1 Tax=Elysia crispata TaxID=231223 RepID=A0AAE1EAR1_9GAST|nr:hypothetical protein RRG08_013392 [Elysia crispata]